jgi:hypothetical protein
MTADEPVWGGEEVWEDAKAGNGEYPARGRRRTSALAEDGRVGGGRAHRQRTGASVLMEA